MGWWTRRNLLRSGIGGALAAPLLGRSGRADDSYRAPADPSKPPVHASATTHANAAGDATSAHSAYGGPHDPPPELGPSALDSLTIPPAPMAATGDEEREVEIWVNEQSVRVANGHSFDAWTYNGSVPGPVLRATEGDRLRIRFQNFGHHAHNVHFHGRHDVSQDGWQPIAAGSSETYSIVAEPFGLHPYHCHALPVSLHVAKGLYGTLIVDPPGGRPPAHEFVLTLCGFDLDGDGRNEVYAWNGVAGYFSRFPIKVPAGELVRLYLLNMVSGDPLASFHLHAETFDVYRSGTRLTPDEHTDVVSLAQSERAIVEFRLPRRGRYMFHPHQIHMAEGGAMGWFAAV